MSGLLQTIDWEDIFSTQPGVSVAIVRDDGTIAYYNQASCDLFGIEPSDEEIIGKKLSDVFRAELVNEWLRWIHLAIETGKPVRGHQVIMAKHLVSSIYPMRAGESKSALLITVRDGVVLPKSETLVRSEYIDLGGLSPLSPRELEVFVMLGHGMSVPDIAKALFRSPRTIERHKSQIGRKIGLSTIADIARVVSETGLMFDDVKLKRIQAS